MRIALMAAALAVTIWAQQCEKYLCAEEKDYSAFERSNHFYCGITTTLNG